MVTRQTTLNVWLYKAIALKAASAVDPKARPSGRYKPALTQKAMFRGFAYLLLLISCSPYCVTAYRACIATPTQEHCCNSQNKFNQTAKAQALSQQYPGAKTDALIDAASSPQTPETLAGIPDVGVSNALNTQLLLHTVKAQPGKCLPVTPQE